MAVNTTSIPFTYSDLNIKKAFEFQNTTYKLRLRENSQADQVGSETSFFTMDVFDENDNVVFSSVIRYKYVFVDSILPGLLFQILPLDPKELNASSNAETEITSENLGITVKLITGLEAV